MKDNNKALESLIEAFKETFQLDYYKSFGKIYAFYNFTDIPKVGNLFGNFFEDIEEYNCYFKNDYLVITFDVVWMCEYFDIENKDKFLKTIEVSYE